MAQRRAVVYGHASQLCALTCWCQRAGLQVVAVATEPVSALAMLCDGEADTLVIAAEGQWRELLPQVLVVGERSRRPRPRRLR